MKNLKHLALTSALAFMPLLAGAQTVPAAGTGFDSDGDLSGFFASVLNFINGTLIPLILGIAFLFFVWGVFQFFIAGGSNDEAKAKGKSLITYAVLGFVIILVFWGLINLLTSATGLDNGTVQTVGGVTI